MSLLLGAAVAVGELGVAAAQTPPPATDIGGQNGTLSDKLRDNDGVIHPQGDIDAGLQKPVPRSGGTMPVVPPPGSPGGDPGIVPK